MNEKEPVRVDDWSQKYKLALSFVGLVAILYFGHSIQQKLNKLDKLDGLIQQQHLSLGAANVSWSKATSSVATVGSTSSTLVTATSTSLNGYTERYVCNTGLVAGFVAFGANIATTTKGSTLGEPLGYYLASGTCGGPFYSVSAMYGMTRSGTTTLAEYSPQ